MELIPRGVVQKPVEKWTPSAPLTFTDAIAAEEPLELRLDGFLGANEREARSLSITMRTPGHDREWAAGFLFTEGLITQASQLKRIAHCGPPILRWGHSNVIKAELADHHRVDLTLLQRHFYTTSSCGVCGKSSLEALKTKMPFELSAEAEGPFVDHALISVLPVSLRRAQAAFEFTGGLHASALFNTHGDLLILREDVGRHNALDKVIGAALLDQRLPLSKLVLMLSGRISFELVQKAAMAGVRVIAAVGAPSSLAIELAQDQGMTLIGFVRGETFNVYTGRGRVR